MHKLLLAVDGSAAAHRAVQYAVALAAVVPSIEVVLLNVQPEIDDWSVLRVLTREEVEAMEESRAGDVLREERAVLQAAGV
ncbi:universal stress protein, partial [Accumulibacter sp.]